MIRWRVTRVEAENFQCWETLDWHLDDLPNVTLIQGYRAPGKSNGSGKSSLLEAICWCLYKKFARKNAKARRRFAKDSDKCWVRCTLEVSSNGTVSSMIAERSEGSFRLTGDGDQATATGAQERLESVFGDFLYFTTTSMFTGEVSSFCRMTDAPRKELLERMTDNARFYEAQQRAKSRRDALQSAIDVESGRIPVHESVIEGCRERRQQAATDCLFRNARLLRNVARIRSACQDKCDEVDAAFAEMLSARRTVTAAVEVARKEADAARAAADAASAAYESAFTAQTAFSAKVDEIRREIARVEREIVDMTSDTHPDICPTCSQRWPHAQDPLVLEKAVTEKRARIQALRKELEPLRAESLAAQERAMTAKEERRRWREKEASARSSGSTRALQAAMADALQAEAELKSMQRDLVTTMDRVDLDDQGSEALEQAEADLDKAKDTLSAAHAHIAELRGDLERVSFWVKGFGRGGLPSYLIDAAIPGMNEVVGEVAAALSDGELSVSFDPDAAKGNQSVFAVKVDFRDGGDGYGDASNGERSRVDMATLFALRELATSRGKAECTQIFLDEVIDGADEHFAEAFIRMVRSRYRDRQIVLISHDPAVLSLCDRSITVRKRGSSATLSTAQ